MTHSCDTVAPAEPRCSNFPATCGSLWPLNDVRVHSRREELITASSALFRLTCPREALAILSDCGTALTLPFRDPCSRFRTHHSLAPTCSSLQQDCPLVRVGVQPNVCVVPLRCACALPRSSNAWESELTGSGVDAGGPASLERNSEILATIAFFSSSSPIRA
jgi:hypothetical protein